MADDAPGGSRASNGQLPPSFSGGGDVEGAALGRLPRGSAGPDGSQQQSRNRSNFEIEDDDDDSAHGSHRHFSRRDGKSSGSSVGSGGYRGRDSPTTSRKSSSFVLALSRWFRSLSIPDDIKLPLFLVAILVVFLATWFLREMLIPFIIAILLTYLLRPAVVVIAQSLDYLFSCCGARCCLNLQAKTKAWWKGVWGCGWCRKKNKEGASGDSAVARKKKDDDNTGGETSAGSGVDDVSLGSRPLLASSRAAASKRGASTAKGNGSFSKDLEAATGTKGSDGEKDKDGSNSSSSSSSSPSSVDPTEFYSVSCSRLIAVILATALAIGVIAILVLIVVDSIHSFHEQYWDAFSARFDAVMANIVAWIKDNLHVDASSLLTSSDKLTKDLLGSASTLVSIANAIMVVVVTLLFMMFLLLDDRFDAGVGVAAAAARKRKRQAERDKLKGLENALLEAKVKAAKSSPQQSDELTLQVAKLEKAVKHSRDKIAKWEDEDAKNKLAASASSQASKAGSSSSITSSKEADNDERMWADIDSAIHRYLIAKTLVSVAMGLLVFLVLGPILHVKLAHLFGVLTIVLNFIPNVGALLAALLPLPIILLDPELSTAAQILAILLPLAIHFVIGNFVEPFVLGPLLSLHPVVVLLSLSFWYVLWGVAGAILAVPITSVVAIALKRSNKHSYAAFIVVVLEQFRLDLSLLRKAPDNGKHGHGGSGGGGSGGGDDPTDDNGSNNNDDDDGGGSGGKAKHASRSRSSQQSQQARFPSYPIAVGPPPGMVFGAAGKGKPTMAFGTGNAAASSDDDFGPFQQPVASASGTTTAAAHGDAATNSTASDSEDEGAKHKDAVAVPVGRE